MVPATPRKEAASAEVAAARALAITCAGLRPRKRSGASRVVATAVVTVEGELVVIELADGEVDLGGMAKRLPGLLLGGCPPPLPDTSMVRLSAQGPDRPTLCTTPDPPGIGSAATRLPASSSRRTRPGAPRPQRHLAGTGGLPLPRHEPVAGVSASFQQGFQPYPALVAQGIEHRSPKAGVAGSNPAGGTTTFPQVRGHLQPSLPASGPDDSRRWVPDGFPRARFTRSSAARSASVPIRCPY